MGIVNTRTMYQTDGGKTLAVEDMTASHLMNAINHHHTQLHTVSHMINRWKANDGDAVYLEARKAGLWSTLQTLMDELATRDPNNDRENSNENPDRW